jgi:MtN3 and saliva related transmembrane protein
MSNVDYIEIIGYVAGFLTTMAYLPQIIKCWRSRHTHDISLPFTLAMAVGIALWLIFGLIRGLAPVVIANSFGLGFVVLLLGLKLRYK